MARPKNMLVISSTSSSVAVAQRGVTEEARRICQEKGYAVYDNVCVQIDEKNWKCTVWLYSPDGYHPENPVSLFF